LLHVLLTHENEPQQDTQSVNSAELCMVLLLLLQMAPGVPWVDSSPSNGIIPLAQPHSDLQAAAAATSAGAAAAAAVHDVHHRQDIKRWGNPQNPRYGDVHFYDYKNDCQVALELLKYPCVQNVCSHSCNVVCAAAPTPWTHACIPIIDVCACFDFQ
jgi:hypothetical protein